MKGIAHFMTGLALATCFPGVVMAARQGSLLPVLGGLGAALPDLLDFRFVRYFEHFDAEIDPGSYPMPTAADRLADDLARLMREAFDRGPRRVIVHTVRLGIDRWQRYILRLDSASGTLSVRLGPVVTTGRVVVSETSAGAPAVRALGFPLTGTEERQFEIDVFTGPSFAFRRAGDDLRVTFLDWHHRWTHSLPVAVAIGVVVGACVSWGWGTTQGAWAMLVAAVGALAHVLEDQLGHMGCNLLWPLTRERAPGLGLLHAGDAIPNFLVVWTSLALILLNLDRLGGPAVISPGPYLLLAVGLPWLLLGGLHLRRVRAGVRMDAEARRDDERLAEAEAHTD